MTDKPEDKDKPEGNVVDFTTRKYSSNVEGLDSNQDMLERFLGTFNDILSKNPDGIIIGYVGKTEAGTAVLNCSMAEASLLNGLIDLRVKGLLLDSMEGRPYG